MIIIHLKRAFESAHTSCSRAKSLLGVQAPNVTASRKHKARKRLQLICVPIPAESPRHPECVYYGRIYEGGARKRSSRAYRSGYLEYELR